MQGKIALLLFALLVTPTASWAEIIIQGGTVTGNRASRGRMPGIIILAPNQGNAATVAYHLQRSHTWIESGRRRKTSGAGLVFSPGLFQQDNDFNDRQTALRNNMSRANAFRLEHSR